MACSAAAPGESLQETGGSCLSHICWQAVLAGSVWSYIPIKSITTGKKGFIEHTLNIYILIKYNLSQWNNVVFIKCFCWFCELWGRAGLECVFQLNPAIRKARVWSEFQCWYPGRACRAEPAISLSQTKILTVRKAMWTQRGCFQQMLRACTYLSCGVFSKTWPVQLFCSGKSLWTDSCVEKLVLFNHHRAMASPTLYFPFLPFLETQNGEDVVRPWKPKGTADNVRVHSSVWQWAKHAIANPVGYFVKLGLKIEQLLYNQRDR